LALLWQTPSAQARGKKQNGKAASEVFYYVAVKDKKFARRYEERREGKNIRPRRSG